MKQLLNDARNHVADMMGSALQELRRTQTGPIGTEPRSPQQEDAMWRKLKLLDPKTFGMVSEAMGQKLGHQPGETQPCQWCDFVWRHAGR